MMSTDQYNIVLIGMPGSGKSIVGKTTAKLMARNFIDTDTLIQLSETRSLQDIVDTDGHMALRRIEEHVILNLHCQNSVIATGGSAVYSHAAMRNLKSNGIVFFLNVDLASLTSRIHDFNTRGLAKDRSQSLADLFQERMTLYRKYADVTVDCRDLSSEEVSLIIIGRLNTGKLKRRGSLGQVLFRVFF